LDANVHEESYVENSANWITDSIDNTKLWSNIVSKSTSWSLVEVVITSPFSNKSEDEANRGVISEVSDSESGKDL